MHTLARFVTKAYTYIIAVWIILVAGMAFLAIQLPATLEGDGFRMDAEHENVMDIASSTFDLPADTLFIVFDQVDDNVISSTIDSVDSLNVTSEIVSPLKDESLYKENLAYARLHFADENQDMDEIVKQIRKKIDDKKGVTLTGQAAITKDINAASQRDLATAEAIGLPIAIIVLLFAFGTVVASLVPIIIGISTVTVAFGMLTLFGSQVELSIFIMNIVPMLGLALSIDFALLFISRYREERKKTSITDAVSITIQTAGRSVLFSAFCVFIGLGAMLLIQVQIFQNIALGGMVVVSVAVISSITLLPAILLVLGNRIEKWQLLRVKQNGSDKWRDFAKWVIKRPIRITIIALILLGVVLIPARNMDLAIPQVDSLPKSYDSRQAYEQMEDTFNLGKRSSAFIIATREDGWKTDAGLKKMKQLEKDLKHDPLVRNVQTIFNVSLAEPKSKSVKTKRQQTASDKSNQQSIGKKLNTPQAWKAVLDSPNQAEKTLPLWERFVQEDKLLIPLTLDASGASEAAQEWARQLSEKESAVNLMVGGEAAFNREIFDEITDKIWLVLTVIVVTTFFVLMLAFRSLLIPIKAILMNIVGLSATFGILVYIFQYGHFGLEAGYIALIIPVIVFSLVFGLSMDYEVFLISRMQEEYVKTQDNDYATVEGLAATSKIITSAALIMIVITGAFAFTDVMPVKQVGVGIAIAVAIDATIIRLLLVPSLMKLFGKRNWWLPFRKGPYRAGSWH